MAGIFRRQVPGQFAGRSMQPDFKAQFLRRWLDEHAIRVSHSLPRYRLTEAHRFERAQRHWVPWRVEAPMRAALSAQG